IPKGCIWMIARSTRSGNGRRRWMHSSISIRPTRSPPLPCWTATTGCGGRRGDGPSRPAPPPSRAGFGGGCGPSPRARLALGHLGETLPFLLWRFDSRAGPDFYAVKLAKRPSQYVKDNVVVATSGMCAAEPLNCTISALGHDRVIFAADYPFESVE